MFRIDDHVGIAIAGLTSDARVLRYAFMFETIWLIIHSNFMRQQAMSSRMVFDRPIPVNRLVSSIADSKSTIHPMIRLKGIVRGSS